ncbi:MAG: class II aldolase/adducin family protein [Novosphingobium sp.]
MAMPAMADLHPAVRTRREDLAALYRIIARARWDDLIFTHISARVEGTDDQFLINPFGFTFDEVSASNLIQIDVRGTKTAPSRHEPNTAGFHIHSAVYRARPDVNFVIHLHTEDSIAVSCQESGLLPLSEHAAVLLGEIAYCSYDTQLLEHPRRMAEALGDRSILMLRNHGTLCAGSSAGDAYLRTHFLQKACAAQVRALTAQVRPISEAALAQAASFFARMNAGDAAWAALLRGLDRDGVDYR